MLALNQLWVYHPLVLLFKLELMLIALEQQQLL